MFVIRDRNSTFTSMFDAVFTGEDIRILCTPVRVPRANAIAERWIGTLRRELLDRILILYHRYLEAVLVEYGAHVNDHRSPRALHQASTTQATTTGVVNLVRSSAAGMIDGLISVGGVLG